MWHIHTMETYCRANSWMVHHEKQMTFYKNSVEPKDFTKQYFLNFIKFKIYKNSIEPKKLCCSLWCVTFAVEGSMPHLLGVLPASASGTPSSSSSRGPLSYRKLLRQSHTQPGWPTPGTDHCGHFGPIWVHCKGQPRLLWDLSCGSTAVLSCSYPNLPLHRYWFQGKSSINILCSKLYLQICLLRNPIWDSYFQGWLWKENFISFLAFLTNDRERGWGALEMTI